MHEPYDGHALPNTKDVKHSHLGSQGPNSVMVLKLLQMHCYCGYRQNFWMYRACCDCTSQSNHDVQYNSSGASVDSGCCQSLQANTSLLLKSLIDDSSSPSQLLVVFHICQDGISNHGSPVHHNNARSNTAQGNSLYQHTAKCT